MAYNVSRGAYDFAIESGVDRAAAYGGGEELINAMIRARLAAMRPKLAEARFASGYSTLQRLGDGTQSGQYGTARAAVEAYGFGNYADAIMQAEGANEQIRQSSSNAWLDVLTNLDSRRDQARAAQRQLDESAPSWFDRALGVAAVFVPGGRNGKR